MSYRNITINAINDEVATNPSALPQIITALSERMAYNKAKGDLRSKGKAAALGRAIAELNANGVLAVDPLGRLDGKGNPKMACWFNPAKLAEDVAAKAAPTPPKVEAPVAEAAFATEASSQAKLLQAQLELRKLDLAGKTSKKAKAELEKLADIEALISSI
tara:strand:+ start:1184 stop:1666 length:483 start_codon:yes stop_codon:yes gene_type:complete